MEYFSIISLVEEEAGTPVPHTSTSDSRVHASVWKMAENKRARFEYLVSSKPQHGQMHQ